MKIFIFRRLYEAKVEKLFWRLVPEQIRLKFAASDPDAQVAASQGPEEVRERLELARVITADSVALARAHQVPVLLITQCHLIPDGARSFHFADPGLDAPGRSLAGPGVYHLSMQEVFSNLPDVKSFFPDSAHLKASGHLLLAQAILRKIQEVHQQLGLTAFKTETKEGGG